MLLIRLDWSVDIHGEQTCHFLQKIVFVCPCECGITENQRHYGFLSGTPAVNLLPRYTKGRCKCFWHKNLIKIKKENLINIDWHPLSSDCHQLTRCKAAAVRDVFCNLTPSRWLVTLHLTFSRCWKNKEVCANTSTTRTHGSTLRRPACSTVDTDNSAQS